MSVYVDPLMEHFGCKMLRWRRSCYMYADTLDELHGMATAIGLRRGWLRRDDPNLPHYDLVSTKRTAAVAAGAIEHTREQMQQFMRSSAPGERPMSLFGGVE